MRLSETIVPSDRLKKISLIIQSATYEEILVPEEKFKCMINNLKT